MANLYVNGATGSDETTKANNTANAPWATIGRAAWGSTDRAAPNASEAAAAGDTVYIAAGTYSVTGSGSDTPVYNPANSGTDGNLITFEAVGTVTLTTTGADGAVIGASGVDYIKWKGFTIDEANAPSFGDTGPANLLDTTGSVIEGCTIDGNGDPGHNDNHNGVRLETAINCTVKNNKIYDVLTSGVNGRNGAAVMSYSSQGCIIEHNEFYGCGSGIFLKGESSIAHESMIVRYNKTYDCLAGIYLMNFNQASQESQRSYVYQNIAYGCDFGITVAGDVSSSNYITVYNNTVYNNTCNIGLRSGGAVTNIIFKNNLSVSPGSQEIFMAGDLSSHTGFSVDYHVYYGSNSWTFNATEYTSLGDWQTAISDDAHSSVADPLFVSAAGADFHLQAGSPALTASDTGGPVGAYITGNETIGIEGASTSKRTLFRTSA